MNYPPPPLRSDTARDVFRSVAGKGDSFYESSNDCFVVAAKTVKVVAYIFIFLFVLACAVASKASLLLMTSGIGNAKAVSVNIIFHCMSHLHFMCDIHDFVCEILRCLCLTF